jgi:hypothetical protein
MCLLRATGGWASAGARVHAEGEGLQRQRTGPLERHSFGRDQAGGAGRARAAPHRAAHGLLCALPLGGARRRQRRGRAGL